MGLRVHGPNNRFDLECLIHEVRALACLVADGDFVINNIKTSDDWSKFYAIYNRLSNESLTWVKYPEFRQLLRFSDCFGIFLPNAYLERIEYSDSFSLGSLDKLHSELTMMNRVIKKNRNKIKLFASRALNMFDGLYDLVKTEHENFGIVFFS